MEIPMSTSFSCPFKTYKDTKIGLTNGSDTSPPAAEAAGGDVYLSSLDFLLQAIGNYLGEPESPCW